MKQALYILETLRSLWLNFPNKGSTGKVKEKHGRRDFNNFNRLVGACRDSNLFFTVHNCARKEKLNHYILDKFIFWRHRDRMVYSFYLGLCK